MMNGVNRMMVPGLATGLDTGQIINDMMRIERLPLDRLQQKRQEMEWRRDDYREMNTLLASFRSQVNNVYLQSHFNKQTIVSADESILSTAVVGNPAQDLYSVEVKQLAQAGKHASKTFAELQVDDVFQPFSQSEAWSDEEGGFSMTITNGPPSDNSQIEIDVTGKDTVATVVGKINEKKEQTGVVAEVVNKRIVLKAVETGKKEEQEITFTVNGDASILGMAEGVTAITGGAEPQQARIVVNGVTLYSDTNRFTYDGMQIDVKQLTGEGQAVALSLSQDVDAIFEQVEDFVEAYNELIEKVQEKLGERYYRDYPPLTDEQREQLSDSEIEKWEDRARSGLLKNDPFLSGVMNELRLDFYRAIEGVGHLSEIGITVGPPDSGYAHYRDGGKLYIDEAKLREAISSESDLVMNIFTQSGTAPETIGIGKRLNDTLHKVTTELTKKAGTAIAMSEVDGSLIGKRLLDMDHRIHDMERRLLQVEDRYWREFTALEKAMERLNQQNDWLMGQLANM